MTQRTKNQINRIVKPNNVVALFKNITYIILGMIFVSYLFSITKGEEPNIENIFTMLGYLLAAIGTIIIIITGSIAALIALITIFGERDIDKDKK